MHPDQLYNRELLLDELYHNAIKLKPREFARFQFDAINRYCPKFQSHILSVNILSLNQDNVLDGDIVSAVVNQPDRVISNYQKYLEDDPFTPQTFLYSGSALFVDAVKPMEVWGESRIYRKHCNEFDQYWVLGISYPFPHLKTSFLAMDYIRVKGEAFSNTLTESYVEYISYPFYLGWLYVHNSGITESVLYQRLELLADMTETRFHLLRCLAGHEQTRSKLLARNLGRSHRTIDNNIAKAYQAFVKHFPAFHDQACLKNQVYQNQRAALVDAYSFMRLGRGGLSRKLPLRNVDR